MPRILQSWSVEEERLLKSLILQRVSLGGSVKDACRQFASDAHGAHSAFSSYWRWQIKLAPTCRADYERAQQLYARRAQGRAMADSTLTTRESPAPLSADPTAEQLLENVMALVDASKRSDLNVQELRSSLDAANRNVAVLERERATLSDRVAAQDDVIAELHARLYALDDTARNLERQLSVEQNEAATEIHALAADLKDTTDQYERTMLAYEELKKSTDNEIASLHTALAELQHKYNERILLHKQDRETANSETSTLRAELTELAGRNQREQETWSARLEDERAQAKRLQDDLFKVKEEHLKQIAILQQEFATERATLAAKADAESHEADRRLQESQLAVQQLIVATEDLRKRYADQTSTIDALRQKLTDARDQYTHVTEEFAAIRAKDISERSSLSARILELEQQAETLKRTSATALSEVRDQYEQTRTELQLLQDRHRKVTDEYGEYRSESERQTATLFKEVWDAMVRNNELLAEYTKVKEENARLIQNVADFSRQVTSGLTAHTLREPAATAAPTFMPSAVEAVRKFDSVEESEFAKARFQRLTAKE